MSSILSELSSRLRGTPTEPKISSSPDTAPHSTGTARSYQTVTPQTAARGSDLHTFAESAAMGNADDGATHSDLQQPLPSWLDPKIAKHIVKGNLMTLSDRPKTVEQGEWLAHQVVEHYRLLWNFVRVVCDEEQDGNTICNSITCPTMSAGRNQSYTWLNDQLEPIEISAPEYMALMQRWISGKIDNDTIFPTDPNTVSHAPNPAFKEVLAQVTEADAWLGRRSGFPRDFSSTCRTIFLQIFRVYAHLYWNHFVQPFYHLNLEKQLNSCFSHFVMTATGLDMLSHNDLEPMHALVDLWAANGTFPPESKAYALASPKSGAFLMQLSGTR